MDSHPHGSQLRECCELDLDPMDSEPEGPCVLCFKPQSPVMALITLDWMENLLSHFMFALNQFLAAVDAAVVLCI